MRYYCKACWYFTPPWGWLQFKPVGNVDNIVLRCLIWLYLHFLPVLPETLGRNWAQNLWGYPRWRNWDYPAKGGRLATHWGVYGRLRLDRRHGIWRCRFICLYSLLFVHSFHQEVGSGALGDLLLLPYFWNCEVKNTGLTHCFRSLRVILTELLLVRTYMQLMTYYCLGGIE